MTRELTHLHKILIQMQREAYQNVRKLAMEYPEQYMSLIIDGKFLTFKSLCCLIISHSRNVARPLRYTILWWKRY